MLWTVIAPAEELPITTLEPEAMEDKSADCSVNVPPVGEPPMRIGTAAVDGASVIGAVPAEIVPPDRLIESAIKEIGALPLLMLPPRVML